jgi:glycosyltransferase involved in cell wall biosynthesis
MSRRLAVPRRRIEVIPRGRDAQLLGRRTLERRRAARASLGVDDDRPLVVAAARHEHQKGLDVLIRAVPLIAQRYPSVRVLIGGREGQRSSELRQLIEELGIDDVVELIGQRDDVPALMCAADVWCVPSRWEGLGSILIEAMCLEVPVVASSVPAICEIAGDPPVFTLVRPDNPNDLALGVLEVLSDPAFAGNRSIRARERFLSEFAAEDVARRMVGFYERSLESSRLARLSKA